MADTCIHSRMGMYIQWHSVGMGPSWLNLVCSILVYLLAVDLPERICHTNAARMQNVLWCITVHHLLLCKQGTWLSMCFSTEFIFITVKLWARFIELCMYSQACSCISCFTLFKVCVFLLFSICMLAARPACAWLFCVTIMTMMPWVKMVHHGSMLLRHCTVNCSQAQFVYTAAVDMTAWQTQAFHPLSLWPARVVFT